jgi:hypothetical protein
MICKVSLCAAAFLLGLAWPAFAAVPSSLCRESAPIPSDPRLQGIRPTQTAVCSYGADELDARIKQLVTDQRAPYTVETIEKIFGTPEMTAVADEPREANYLMRLSGKDGWQMLVGVSEGFYPLDKGPAKFVPGPHPKRLDKFSNAWLNIQLGFVVLGEPPKPGLCMEVSPLLDEAIGSGWKYIINRPPPPDGGPQYPALSNGDKGLTITGERGECAQYIDLGQRSGSLKH